MNIEAIGLIGLFIIIGILLWRAITKPDEVRKVDGKPGGGGKPPTRPH